jgi:hypothetical protein
MRISKLILLFVIIFPLSVYADESSCVICHRELGGIYTKIVKDWEKSIHNKINVSCSNCHGGDPTSLKNPKGNGTGFIGKLKPQEIPILCAKCHSDVRWMRQYNLRTDQFSEYKTSQHGKLLFEKGNTEVATCINCHGSHAIQKKDLPSSSVYKLNIPYTCSKCHSNEKLMKRYGIPYDQMDQYKKSIHGKLLLERGDLRAPTCADCHGIHGATPPGIEEVENVCGNCHAKEYEFYSESPHQKAMEEVGIPKCISCHGNHDIKKADYKLFYGKGIRHCGYCHKEDTIPYRSGIYIGKLIENEENILKKIIYEVNNLGEKGVDISQLNLRIIETKAKLTGLKPLTHTLSVERIKREIYDISDDIGRIDKKIEEEKNQLRFGKRVLIIILFVTLTIIGLLYMKKMDLRGS